MPRKSSASAESVQVHFPISRPEPPPDLSEKEALQWRKIVDSLPPLYFDPAAQAVLADLCRTAGHCDEFGRWFADHRIDTLKTPQQFREHARMSRLYHAASSKLVTLSTKLRLLPQNRYQARTADYRAGRNPDGTAIERPVRKPWERFRD